MAREWYTVYSGWLEFGIDWFAESYDDRVVVDIHVYRWDNWNTDNSGGRYWESLNPDPNNGNTYAEWTGLTYGSGSGTRVLDDWATRTYYRQNSGYNVALRVGWDSSTGTYTSNGFEYVGSGSHTWNLWIDPLPAANTYNIYYDDNGGTGGPGSQTKTQGTALTISSTVPTREGYKFLGWSYSKSASLATFQPGGSITGDESVTLYAIWRHPFDCPHTNISSLVNISWCLGAQDIECCRDVGEEQNIYICKDCGWIKVTSATIGDCDCCDTWDQGLWNKYLNQWINPTVFLPATTVLSDPLYSAQYNGDLPSFKKLGGFFQKLLFKKIYDKITGYFGYDILYSQDYDKWAWGLSDTVHWPVHLNKSAFNYQKLIIEAIDNDNRFHTLEIFYPDSGKRFCFSTVAADSSGFPVYIKLAKFRFSDDGTQLIKDEAWGERSVASDNSSSYNIYYLFHIIKVVGIKKI